MRINQISSFTTNYNNKNTSFKHTAVPYPEYENVYKNNKSALSDLVSKLSELFRPEVTKNAKEIKSGIDALYGEVNNLATPTKEAVKTAKDSSKKQLLSVLA